MGCPWTSTLLDQEQIERDGTAIAVRRQPVEAMPVRLGTEVAEELGHRYLVRYLTDSQVSLFSTGSTDRAHWVTPTPYGVEDVVSWLALFAPRQPRRHALLLDTIEISEVCGPAWIRLGQGIEYYLPRGFPEAAVVDVGVVQVR